MFWMRNKENNFPIRTLIWRPGFGRNSFSNSFYGHPFPSAVSIRAEISFLRKSGHYLEQCRWVNPFIRTGVFSPFKLICNNRELSVVTCNGSDIKPFT